MVSKWWPLICHRCRDFAGREQLSVCVRFAKEGDGDDPGRVEETF